MLTIGIDLGSTTVKYALLSESGVLLSHDYVRHGSAVKQTLEKVLRALALRTHDAPVHVLFSGSGALGLADALGASFVQEVIAASRYLKHRAPDLDAAIELGGEDAKLLYLSNGVELRMNEACAGGTGAFIDQMASLLDVDAAGLNKLASEAQISHPMASRCGVFAKTDLVALLNGGVPKSEVARSVLDAVAEQTVSGLACGRPVRGKIAFLGGPLTFLSAALPSLPPHQKTDGLIPEKKRAAKNRAISSHSGCPGSKIMQIRRIETSEPVKATSTADSGSKLQNWPVQIKLAPVNAPYFNGSKLLIAADCTAYAYAAFHQDFIRNKVTLIGCPKLDQVDYSEKLTAIIQNNNIQSVTIVRMEVPCCGGLEIAAKKALQASGKFIPWQVVTISIDGKIME